MPRGSVRSFQLLEQPLAPRIGRSTTSFSPFAEKAATNLPLPLAPKSDAGSAAMVANLNSSWHSASLYEYGKPIYDASAGTPRTIVCTEQRGVPCGLSLQPVAVNAVWKSSSASPSSMTVIDYTNRKVYDFYAVATDADGSVKINADGTVSTSWGRVTDLDGNGQSPGSLLPDSFGTVRVFEMRRALSDPANAVRHALAVTNKFACSTYRYPATKSDGIYTGTGCIPAGSRLFLDSTANCSTVTPAGEKALCYALQKYGAYVTDSGARRSPSCSKPRPPGYRAARRQIRIRAWGSSVISTISRTFHGRSSRWLPTASARRIRALRDQGTGSVGVT